jgi:U3 small nucleolar RNA-associated protein 11
MEQKADKAMRKSHKERSQPHKREKLGMLEKGKDWKERREDFHKKKIRLNALQEKARNRNPDEFYFGMIKSKTKDGVHQQRRDSSKIYSADEMKLIRTQDLAYINSRRNRESKNIEQLQGTLHLVDAEKPNSHTVFVDTKKEAASFDPVAYFQTAPELVNRKSNRPRVETLQAAAVVTPGRGALKKVEAARTRSYDELLQRMERKKKMTKVADELQLQKRLLGKGRRDMIGKDKYGRPMFKWRRERKT